MVSICSVKLVFNCIKFCCVSRSWLTGISDLFFFYFDVVPLDFTKLASLSTESNSGHMLSFRQLFILPSTFCSGTSSLFFFSFSMCLWDCRGLCHLHEFSRKAMKWNTWSIAYAPSDMFSLSHSFTRDTCAAIPYSKPRDKCFNPERVVNRLKRKLTFRFRNPAKYCKRKKESHFSFCFRLRPYLNFGSYYAWFLIKLVGRSCYWKTSIKLSFLYL